MGEEIVYAFEWIKPRGGANDYGLDDERTSFLTRS
jgi:hypothetical protein